MKAALVAAESDASTLATKLTQELGEMGAKVQAVAAENDALRNRLSKEDGRRAQEKHQAKRSEEKATIEQLAAEAKKMLDAAPPLNRQLTLAPSPEEPQSSVLTDEQVARLGLGRPR